MFQLAGPVTAEIEIKKSRFIARLYPVSSRVEAQALLAGLRREWPDARHYCAVLLVAGDSMLDDDGEPSGTAAKPMYNVLMHKNVGNVLAVVVRYFGGIKLGAGGLVRAYGQAVGEALKLAELQEVVPLVCQRMEVAFANESRVRRHCTDLGMTVLEVQYGQSVQLLVQMPQQTAKTLLDRLCDLMAGEVYFMTDAS